MMEAIDALVMVRINYNKINFKQINFPISHFKLFLEKRQIGSKGKRQISLKKKI